MTIYGWVIFVFLSTMIFGFVLFLGIIDGNPFSVLISIVISVFLILALFFGMRWYFNNTASGQRSLVDQKSDISGGLERTITIYTADGNVIAKYTGKIDIEGNDGGYVLFDYEGKRYTYYNCFVESIADIK